MECKKQEEKDKEGNKEANKEGIKEITKETQQRLFCKATNIKTKSMSLVDIFFTPKIPLMHDCVWLSILLCSSFTIQPP